jgi:hypothetical protein
MYRDHESVRIFIGTLVTHRFYFKIKILDQVYRFSTLDSHKI